MTFKINHKRVTEVVIDCATCEMSIMEALGNMTAMKISGRYSDFIVTNNQILGVIA